MLRRPTQEDVARRAGVSKATVGFSLTNRYDIGIPETTRQRVKQAAEEIGYRPNLAARALASGRTNTITVAFPGTIDVYHSNVLQFFERITNAHGYHLIATTIGHIAPSNALPDLWDLLNAPNDAIVLVDVFDRYRPYVDELVPSSKPVVSMGIVDVTGVDSVHVDISVAAAAACNHLFLPNKDHVVFFGANVSNTDHQTLIERSQQGQADPRCVAYYRAATERGIEPVIISGVDWTRAGTIAALKQYVAVHGCPDAIICTNDVLAIRVHGELRRLGYRIPQDVRIVGCDGIEVSEDVAPSLSTIVQPVQEMCKLTWDLLQARLADPEIPRQYARLVAELRIRGSSDASLE
ncbi:MAG: LacI family DNA-binding transcriptional regulator [Capsulimonas sp.]|uniref:LacI family DNA-binding transcriptional regulator n=1 Tax=Capsulimonas sp. TaxID=2494211 RepID=UPI00326505E9